jgi:hypothetical protein
VATKNKKKPAFDSLFEKVIAEMRTAQEKVNSQVSQWASKAEAELQLEKTVQKVIKRIEDLQHKQMETMQKWQKDMENRFNTVLEFQKSMLDSLIPGGLKKHAAKPDGEIKSATKSVAKKATAKKSAARKTVAKKTTTNTIKKSTAKKTTAKKTNSRKSVAKAPTSPQVKPAPAPAVESTTASSEPDNPSASEN